MTSDSRIELTSAPDDHDIRFDPLPPAMEVHLQKRRKQIKAKVATAFPGVQARWPLEPEILQRVVDSDLLDRSDEDAWKALGIAFGDLLATRVPDLTWVQVTDAWGIDAVLRQADLKLAISASTMLIKRVESGEPIDIASLLVSLEQFITARSGRQN